MSPRIPSPRAPEKPSVSEAVEAQKQRRAQKIRDLQDDAQFDRLRTPTARRTLIVAGYLTMLGSSALAWVDPPGLASVTAPLLFLVGLGIALLLNRVVRHAGDPYDDALDERLIVLRDEAFHRSYPILVLAVLGGLLFLMVGLGDDVEHRHLEALFFGVGIAAVMTPLAVLNWSGEND